MIAAAAAPAEAARALAGERRFAEAAALPMTDPAGRLERGRLFLRYGREAEAEADLDAAAGEPSLAPAVTIERALLALRRTEPAERAHAAADAVLDGTELADGVRARALLLRGLAEHRLDRWQQAQRDLVEALAAADRADDVATRIDILRALGIVHIWRGRHSQAILHLTLALADCAVLGDVALTADLLGELGRANLEMRRHGHALEFLRRQERIAGEWLDRREALRLRLGIVQALNGVGDHAAAAELAIAAFNEAQASGFSYLALVAGRELAHAEIEAGRLDLAAAAIDKARPFAGEDPESYDRLTLATVEAELAAARGTTDADALIARVIDGYAARDLVAPEIEARLVEAELLARRGFASSASRTLRVALGRARTNGLNLLEDRVREAMTRFDVSEGLSEEADRPIASAFGEAESGYVLLEKLGAGRYGAVFRAFDLERGREVALKRMTAFDGYDSAERKRLLDSARNELEAAARVSHPGVARVLAVGDTPDGGIYVVQDFITGPSLRSLMRDPNHGAPASVAAILRRIALALGALHAAGLVHRDVKPENILCPASDRPVLVDLGIAATLESKDPAASRGTEGYAAPEQWAMEAVAARSDLYALGVIAFEWLTGRRPDRAAAEAQSRFWRRLALSEGDAAALRSAAPKSFAELVEALLAPDPDRRPTSADAVIERLDSVLG